MFNLIDEYDDKEILGLIPTRTPVFEINTWLKPHV